MMDLIEAIRRRRSTRTYRSGPLSADEKNTLEAAIAQAESPFGPLPAMALVVHEMRGGLRGDTYGMVHGAENFLLMGCGETIDEALSAGYAMERVVLEATRMGLGTCWMAASFKSGTFVPIAGFDVDKPLRIVAPVGSAAERKWVGDRIAGFLAGSRKRKPMEELFFDCRVGNPLPATNEFAPALELMRLAPSSLNSQPWRAIVESGRIHFYSRSSNFLSMIDCGIGLCHFAIGIADAKVRGAFCVDPNGAAAGVSSGLFYLTSFTLDKATYQR